MLAFFLISFSYSLGIEELSYADFEKYIEVIFKKENNEESICDKDLSIDDNFYECSKELEKDLSYLYQHSNKKEK